MRYEGTARLGHAFQNGSAKHVVFSTLGPGSLGGDTVTIHGSVGPGAHLIVTTQSATRAYGPGRSSMQATWSVADGGVLELRLEPLLLFAHADYVGWTQIELAEGAQLHATDFVALAEDGEAQARVVTVVRRHGRLVLRDALALDRTTLRRGTVGTLVGYGCDVFMPPKFPENVRLGVGATLDGGTFIRVTGPKVWELRELLRGMGGVPADCRSPRGTTASLNEVLPCN